MTKLAYLFLVLVILAGGCTPNHPRFQPSGRNTTFQSQDSFQDYIEKSEKIIAQGRFDLNDDNRDKIIAANSPFELLPDEHLFPRREDGRFEKGALLIHGLADSPYAMRPLARHLQSQGFMVRAILLPGHGTCPGDLTEVNYREWLKAAEYGINSLKKNVNRLFVGGYSTGAALSIYLAQQHTDIEGLLLLAPSLAIKTNWAHLIPYIKYLTDWLLICDDADSTRYESFSVNSVVQVYNLTQELDELIENGLKLSIPVFAAVSSEDIVIDPLEFIDFFKNKIVSKKSVLLVYSSSPDDFMTNDPRILVKNSHLPQEKIHDFSHLSMTMPPDDPHYGKDGDYINCLHYRNQSEEKKICLEDNTIEQGEISSKNKKQGVMRRLTYHPGFYEMMNDLDLFLDGLH
ncbi:MAG: alpha/beta fold hydrolase [Desulfobulbaceae bacterium]|nr:alpha/beta fold hydrolase [Desulfobulbaceae bacterium]